MHNNLIERVQVKIIPEPMSGCWLWIGNKTPRGYGHIPIGYGRGNYKYYGAHRYVYEQCTGNIIPDKAYLCHKCDTPACVNPDHLFIGSAQDNNIDCMLKGRQPKTKLTVEKVREMFALRANGMPTRNIALLYGVSRNHAGKILKGDKWKWAHGEANDAKNI